MLVRNEPIMTLSQNLMDYKVMDTILVQRGKLIHKLIDTLQ
jgi:hypothetical protein